VGSNDTHPLMCLHPQDGDSSEQDAQLFDRAYSGVNKSLPLLPKFLAFADEMAPTNVPNLK